MIHSASIWSWKRWSTDFKRSNKNIIQGINSRFYSPLRARAYNRLFASLTHVHRQRQKIILPIQARLMVRLSSPLAVVRFLDQYLCYKSVPIETFLTILRWQRSSLPGIEQGTSGSEAADNKEHRNYKCCPSNNYIN